MSTDLARNDIRFYQSTANSTITLDSGSEYASANVFISGSSNITSPTTASIYYNSINHLFYNKQDLIYLL